MKSINLMKNVGRFTPPKIAKSDLPSNHLYDLPPQNRQVRFNLKSSVRTLKSSITTDIGDHLSVKSLNI